MLELHALELRRGHPERLGNRRRDLGRLDVRIERAGSLPSEGDGGVTSRRLRDDE